MLLWWSPSGPTTPSKFNKSNIFRPPFGHTHTHVPKHTHTKAVQRSMDLFSAHSTSRIDDTLFARLLGTHPWRGVRCIVIVQNCRWPLFSVFSCDFSPFPGIFFSLFFVSFASLLYVFNTFHRPPKKRGRWFVHLLSSIDIYFVSAVAIRQKKHTNTRSSHVT